MKHKQGRIFLYKMIIKMGLQEPEDGEINIYYQLMSIITCLSKHTCHIFKWKTSDIESTVKTNWHNHKKNKHLQSGVEIKSLSRQPTFAFDD